MSSEEFWLENPLILLKNKDIIPKKDDKAELKHNSLTRLIIIIAIILFFTGLCHWQTFLINGLLLVIVMQYFKDTTIHTQIKNINSKIEDIQEKIKK